MPKKVNKKHLRDDLPFRRNGLTWPGHDFLGPFNVVDYAPPRNAEDVTAKYHDIDYNKNSDYYTFNKADAKFISETDRSKTNAGKFSNMVFRGKERLSKWGVLPKGETFKTPPSHKRFRSEPDTPHKPRNEAVRRRIFPNSNTQVRAIQNMDTNMEGKGSGNNAGLVETPIDDPYQVYRGPPDFTFASLPYFRVDENLSTVYCDDVTFRMTSPYDCYVGRTSVDINTGAGSTTTTQAVTDGVDARDSHDKSRWFDLYAGMYKYYHVLSCRWVVTIENLGNDLIMVHKMHYTDTLPPQTATNQDMSCWVDCDSYLVGSHAVAIENAGRLENNDTTGTNLETGTQNNTPNYENGNHVNRRGASPILTLSGQYSPGDFTRQIRQDASVENWTLTSTNPTLPERLLLRFKHYNDAVGINNASSYDRVLSYTYRMKIEYLVEFKELKDGLKYPVQRQPLTVTIQQDVTSEN